MLKKLSFRNKLLLSYLAYGVAMAIVAIFTIYNVNNANIKNLNQKDMIKKFAERKAFFNEYTEHSKRELFTLKDSKIFKNYIKDNSNENNVEELFSYMIKSCANVMQLRYIDKNGFEKIRMDKTNYDSTPFLIEKNKLQNKSNRYYFKETMQLKRGEIWYSNIDLNIEYNKIEKPIKPVLRIGIPVYNKNEKTGILIINIFMEYILDKILDSQLYNIYLIDKEGNFILHPDKTKRWNKYLNKNYTIKALFKEDYKKILNSNRYYNERLYSRFLDFNNTEEIRMIIEPKFYKTQQHIQEQINNSIYIMILMILTSFPVAYFFSFKFATLKAIVDRLNSSLEKRVKRKTKELQELNKTLEQRVKEEVDKNREKEKQLLHQSRLAQMGEMISMIAHQWRQPLAAISSTAGTLKLDILMDNYKKEFFEKSLGNISDYSQHLSSTINDFRNFFKDNKEKQETKLEEIIENSLEIIGSTLNSDNIKLVKKYECNEIFYNYPNELKQVVLNLIKNAEDVLLEQSIKNPTIYLKTYLQKNKYILEVSDNAGGIPKDIMHNIFMPYFSTKKNKEGTGLGLYMSKIIIEDNCNGKLYFKNSDEGAVFTIELKSKKN